MAASDIASRTTLAASPRVCQTQSLILDAPKNRRIVQIACVILAWFALNICIGSLTKWTMLYGEVCIEGNCAQFTFPLTITVVHMLFSWVMCGVYLFLIKKQEVVQLSLQRQIRTILPLAAAFAISVAGGNLSLKYIYPSFNQMLGSVSPLITVTIAVAFQHKRYNRWTWVSMPIICGGLLLCSAKEVNFHALGALFATGATIMRSVKSIVQGKLLTSAEPLDSVSLLYYMAPWAALLLELAALGMEGTAPIRLLATAFSSPEGAVTGGSRVLALLVVGGAVACLLNIANFLVTFYTSAVTLQVLGNVKNCLAIIISVWIFNNPLLPLQAIGVVICLSGVWLYNRRGGVVKPVANEHGQP